MTNYLALSAIPLLMVVQWKEKRLHRVWPLVLLPLIASVGWIGLQSAHYHRFILGPTARFAATEAESHWFDLGEKTLSTLLNLGAALSVTALFQLKRWRGVLLWVLLGLGIAALAAKITHWHPLHCVLLALFLVSALKVARTCRQVSADLFLNLWILGFLAACLLVYYHGSVRYVLPLVVPVSLALGNWPGWSRRRMAGCVAATLIYALLLAHADYQFAALYPRIAQKTIRDYPGKRVWSTGEWGFRYYMERSGAQTLTREDQRPDAGDLLVKPGLAMSYVTGYDDNDHVALLHREFVFLSNPIRLLDFSSHAGFYSTGWGILPWSVAVEPLPAEMFNFFQVLKRFEGDASKMRQDYFR
jgi:hypothetical protein